jgi:hypothetical protein
MSYTGQRSLAALGAILLMYGAYFVWAAAPGRSVDAVSSRMAGTVLFLVIVLVVLEIGVAINAVRTGQTTGLADERDRLIAARSARNGYFAVFSGLWFMPFLALSGASSVLIANCLLGLMVFAEAVHFASRAIYDRCGG